MPRIDTRNVLFVCTANRCRSPLAAATLAHRSAAVGLPWSAASAGTRARSGDMTEPEVLQVLADAGIHLAARAARRVDDATVAADLVLTAERSHRSQVLERYPSLVGRAFTLLEFERLLMAAPAGPVGTRRTLAELAAAADGARSTAGAGGTSDDLGDPIGQPLERFRDCQRRVERAVATIIAAAG